MLDPYAKAISGQIDGHESLFSYRFSDPTAFNDLDFGHTMLSVVDPVLRLGPRSTTAAPVSREHHLRDAPEGSHEDSSGHSGRDPRSYAAMRHPAIIEHLTSLGITAVELLPVHQFVNDTHLRDHGLSNYWGYNTIGFLAPHSAYASVNRGQQTTEFKSMVKALHEADIEVILDVVYNHRGRQSAGTDDRLPGHRQRCVLPLGRWCRAALLRHHWNRQ